MMDNNDNNAEGLRKSTWSPEADVKLMRAVEFLGGPCFETDRWVEIAAVVGENKNNSQCMHRWSKVLKPCINKQPWPDYMVETLKQAVETHGTGDWQKISEDYFAGIKTGKQCREKYMNTLSPELTDEPWDDDQDILLVTVAIKMKQTYDVIPWEAIKKQCFPNRSANNIKNRYNVLLKR
jgi:hypothetical protein